MENKTNETQRILIVEDSSACLEALEWGVKQVFPASSHDLARTFWVAQNYAAQKNYLLILLDNRLPYCETDRTDSACGYYLIGNIRKSHPATLIAGTSSLSDLELKDLPKPDFRVRKDWIHTKKELENIVSHIQRMKGGNE